MWPTDARDFLVEYRTGGSAEAPLQSTFVHVLEGYREGETSAIAAVEALSTTRLAGPARQIVAVRLRLVAGHTDTVVFQSQPGAIRLSDGVETDARYALPRRSAEGQVVAADAVRGTQLRRRLQPAMPGDFTGTIVTSWRPLAPGESARWFGRTSPGPGTNLRDRQLNVRVTSALRDPCDEGYRIAKPRSGARAHRPAGYAPFV